MHSTPDFGNMTNTLLGQTPQSLPIQDENDSMLDIPTPYSAICPLRDGVVRKGRRGGFFQKLRRGLGNRKEGFKMVKVTREEFLMYW